MVFFITNVLYLSEKIVVNIIQSLYYLIRNRIKSQSKNQLSVSVLQNSAAHRVFFSEMLKFTCHKENHAPSHLSSLIFSGFNYVELLKCGISSIKRNTILRSTIKIKQRNVFFATITRRLSEIMLLLYHYSIEASCA